MDFEEYLRTSRLFRRLRSGPQGPLVERFAARLVADGRVRHGTWRCLDVVDGLLSWIASRHCALGDLDEAMVERYLRYRGARQSIQPGDRAALKRWLSVLRETGTIAPAARAPSPGMIGSSRHSKPICGQSVVWRRSPSSVTVPVIRRFLHEVYPGGDNDLGKITQESVIRYIERHAKDRSPKTGKVMCWSLRAFFRYCITGGKTRARWSTACRRYDDEGTLPCRPICRCAGADGTR